MPQCRLLMREIISLPFQVVARYMRVDRSFYLTCA